MEQAYWLAWSQVGGIGAVTLKRLWQSFGSLAEAWHADLSQIAQVYGIGAQTLTEIRQARLAIDPQALYAQHCQLNPQWWTPAEQEYPQLLKEIPDPPAMLYWQGSRTQWWHGQAVAIVGTRQPTKYGRAWAYKLGKALAEAGFVVVSGLAEGIDSEAHRGCLSAGGQAIAVIGTSLDKIYPPQNRQLSHQISQTGLIFSEYPHGTPTEKAFFPRRNRIIAGLCRATLVIEAPAKSGALITAHQANDYGREVYALPNSLETAEARGCLELIAKGAGVILGVEELLTALGSIPPLDQPAQMIAPEPEITNPLHRQIWLLLPASGSLSLDAIAEHTALPAGQLSALLLEMELLGIVKNCGGMNFSRSD